MLDAITGNLSRTAKIFFLLIDDTDQVAAPDVPDHLNRIWAFLLAARDLCMKVPDVKCIATLRTEVWMRLQSERSGQRDQVDYFLPLVVFHNPSDADITAIYERRVFLAWKSLGSPSGKPEPFFFDGPSVELPSSNDDEPVGPGGTA